VKFHETSLQGAFLLEPERRGDTRGYFARVFCADEFAAHGLESQFVQVNHSHNIHCGTLRGMHFQQSPHGEVKLVRALRGAVHDVIIDLRDGSRTHGRWEGFDLTAENGHMLYVPAGFAHGFQTLEDNTDITYMVSHRYVPEAEAGVRWEDPTFAIDWPLPVTVISEKDSTWPLIDPQQIASKTYNKIE
jgi:dTDP-4-dehydrorhamnose 3,5-epimerase